MSNILCSIPIKDIQRTEYLSIHEAHKQNAIASNVFPPTLHRPCRPDSYDDTPYFRAYEGVINGNHYIYIRSFVGTDDYQYYCPEMDKYKRFSGKEICEKIERYTKFIIYKYFE